MRAFREHVSKESSRSYSFSVTSLKDYNYGLHYHPECELTVFESGSGIRMMGDHIEEFRAGDMVFIPPNLPHNWDFNQGSILPEKSKLYVIKFIPAELHTLLNAPDLQSVLQLLSAHSSACRIVPNKPERLFKYLQSLEGARPAEAFGLLIQLLDYIRNETSLQRLSKVEVDSNQANTKRLQSVCEHLQQHFQEPVQLEAVARVAHLSPAAFSRYFSQQMGKPFSRYLNELRISYACNRLLDSEDTVLTIALDAGFQSLTNFNRQFRAIRGMTPRQYRAKRQRNRL